MPKQNLRIAWAFAFIAFGGSCVIALLAAPGLPWWSVVTLCVLTGLFLTIAAGLFGWFKAPYAIGTLPRIGIILAIIWSVLFCSGWWLWSQRPQSALPSVNLRPHIEIIAAQRVDSEMISVLTQNTSPYRIESGSLIMAAGFLTPGQIDEDKLFRYASRHSLAEPTFQNVIYPGQTIRVNTRLRPWDFLNGDRLSVMYVTMIAIIRDENGYLVSEGCYVLRPDGSSARCSRHNTTYPTVDPRGRTTSEILK